MPGTKIQYQRPSEPPVQGTGPRAVQDYFQRNILGPTWYGKVRQFILDALENPANEVMLQPWMAVQLLGAGTPGQLVGVANGQQEIRFWDAAERATPKPGAAYRGMSSEEFADSLRQGAIKSDQRWSAPNEGTSFADDLATAEDYANFGRTNPARTGQSSYAVEVQSAIPQRGADSYLKAKEAVPLDQAQTVWRFDPSGGMVEVPLHSKNPWVRQWILQGLR